MVRRVALPVAPEDLEKIVQCLQRASPVFALPLMNAQSPETLDQIFYRNLEDLKLKATSRSQSFHCAEILELYIIELRENHALDFNDLIIHVSELFKNNEEVLARWQERFRWIQVDEVQDTNWSEYSILSAIGRKHRQLSFFGDVDQTIYEWRGSVPQTIIAVFKKEFGPIVEINLKAQLQVHSEDS